MSTTSIPAPLIEAGVGALLIMFVVKMVYMIAILWRSWRDSGRWRLFYTYENKAAFAMLTISIGMMFMLGAMWWTMHMKNHGYVVARFALAPLFVAGTLVAIWGVLCLIRALTPYKGPKWQWFAIGAFAIVSAVFMAS